MLSNLRKRKTNCSLCRQLAPPLEIVSSDGDIRCVGLIYSSYVCIFAVSPTIKLISKINKTVLSAFWLRGTFFYATPTTIEAGKSLSVLTQLS